MNSFHWETGLDERGQPKLVISFVFTSDPEDLADAAAMVEASKAFVAPLSIEHDELTATVAYLKTLESEKRSHRASPPINEAPK